MSVNVRRFSLNVLASACARRPARLLAWVLQQIEGRLDRKQLAADLEAQTRNGLVEQPVPGGIGGHRLLVKELLDAILELIRLLLAQIFDPGTIMASAGVAHRGFERGIL